jgi:DNA-binding NarL/FixJ family response regulator
MLTERERKILELHNQGLNDYKIAKRLGLAPTSIRKSRLNALKKLHEAQEDVTWAHKLGTLRIPKLLGGESKL